MSPRSPTRASPALKAGLKLTAEQEKNWPAVETAIRDLAKQRADRMKARRSRGERREARRGRQCRRSLRPDAIARMRDGADAMTARAAGLKKLADAVRAALQEPRRRPEAPLRRAASHGRPGRHAAPPLAPPRRRPLSEIMNGGGDRLLPRRSPHAKKPPGTPGGFCLRESALLPAFAGQPGLALLHDARLCGLLRKRRPGRIAQLVEQLTLNQRVPGSRNI